MHARMDRRKYAIQKKYSNRYQLENSTGRNDRQNALGNYSNRCALVSILKWMSVGTRIWTPDDTGSGPLRGLRPSWDIECAPKDSTIGIYCYMARNDRLVQMMKWVERVCPDLLWNTLHATPNVCPEATAPLNGWMRSICNIPQSESDDRWLHGSVLAGSLLGRNESAIWDTGSIADLRILKITCALTWLSYALHNEYS